MFFIFLYNKYTINKEKNQFLFMLIFSLFYIESVLEVGKINSQKKKWISK